MKPEDRETVERLLDRGEWKHSWHVPRDRYGYIDYQHPETIKIVREQIEEAREQALALNQLADKVQRIMQEEQKCDEEEADPADYEQLNNLRRHGC